MPLQKYKREPETWNKHVVPYLESEATSFFADTAHPFRLIPWLLELDSGIIGDYSVNWESERKNRKKKRKLKRFMEHHEMDQYNNIGV